MTVTQPVRFGWHYDTESIPFEKAIPAMQASKASAHLMMVNPRSFWLGDGDIANIKKVLNALPNCVIIVRIFHTLQGDWKSYPAATEYESHWRTYKTKFSAAEWARLVWDDHSNEPMISPDNVNEIRAYVTRCVDLVKAAGRVGMKFAVGAWSVGTPHERWFETEFMVLWQAIADNGQAISAHAYGTIPSMAGETLPIELALDPAASLASMTEQRVPLSSAGWLIIRMYRVIKIWEKYNLGTVAQPYPELYITEGIIDNIYNSGNSNVKDQWRAMHGMDEANDDPRGPRSFTNFLNKMFTGQNKSFSQQLAVIHRWARRFIFYHPAFKAVCLFALNFQWDYRYASYSSDGQHKQALSNFDRPEYDDFRMIELPAINAEILEEIPMPQFPLFPSRFKSLKISNVRSTADTEANNIIYALGVDWVEGKIAKEGVLIAGSSFTWLEIVFNHPATATVISGFVAKTSNLVIEDLVAPPPPEPLYSVELGHMTLLLTAEQIDQHATVYESLAMLFREAIQVE